MENNILHFSAGELKNLIRNNELARVLEELSCITKGISNEIYNELIMHYRRFNKTQKERSLNILDKKQLEIAENSITYNLLELIDKLDKSMAFDNTLLPNRMTCTITLEGDFTNYTPQMGAALLAFLSTICNGDMNNFTIKDAYSGSINIVIEVAEVGVVGLVEDALKHALNEQGVYSTLHHKELSTQLASNIFDTLDKEEAPKWPDYIRRSVNECMVHQAKKASIQHGLRPSPSKTDLFEKNQGWALLDVFIKEEYLTLNTSELARVRAAIGDTDYLMIEAHFRENESYKTIADKMGFAVSVVAHCINLARKICQKLKNEGQIDC